MTCNHLPYTWWKAGLLVMAGILLFTTLRLAKPVLPGAEPTVAAKETGQPAAAKTSSPPARPRVPAPAPAPQPAPSGRESATAQRPAATPDEAEETAAGLEALTPRQQALAAWESLVDEVLAQKETPAAQQAKRVKEAFDKLDKEDQADGVRRALNLFPDEQFPALYAILFDKTEAPEVLDAIFSDALNRPEELKNPLLKELRLDREHPLYPESARILEVVEPEAE